MKTKFIIFMITICVVGLSISVFVFANNSSSSKNLSKEEKQSKYKELKEKVEKKEATLDKNSPEGWDEVKNTYIDMSKLGYEAMSEKELEETYENFILSMKRGLEDTKLYNDMTDPKIKKFVEKSETKIKRLEAERKSGKKSTIDVLRELEDRSDVDN